MLELRGIEAGYGGVTVLRDVSLAVPSGSVVALLGANGAGKTTLLRVASGLLTPLDGRMFLGGHDISGATPHELVDRGVCHVPEGLGIFRSMTVRENLELLAPPGSGAREFGPAVEAFPVLADRMSQVAGTLSGGEQQMLALARAWLSHPRYVLLDEVSMGLAPVVVDEIFAALQALARQGASLLIVEQYVGRVLDLADVVYVLKRGRVVFAGQPAELDGGDVFSQYTGLART